MGFMHTSLATVIEINFASTVMGKKSGIVSSGGCNHIRTVSNTHETGTLFYFSLSFW